MLGVFHWPFQSNRAVIICISISSFRAKRPETVYVQISAVFHCCVLRTQHLLTVLLQNESF